MRSHRAPRVWRGAVAATVATFAALVSHVAAGGVPPRWVGIAVPFALALLVCTALAGRRLSLLRLSVSVLLSQVFFHVLFVLGTGAPSGSGSSGTVGHQHGALSMPMPISGATAEHLHATPLMWAGHVLGAVVTVAALYTGERLLRRICALATGLTAWLRRVWQRPIAVPLARRSTVAITHSLMVVPALGRYVSSASRRGPPRAFAF